MTTLALPINEERAMRTRERALAKARRVARKRADGRRRRLERDRQQFRTWLQREQRAFGLHLASPESAVLRRAWLKVLAERPPLYGRKEA